MYIKHLIFAIFFISKTLDELSIVVSQSLYIDALKSDLNWRALEIFGPLNLSLVGIMAEISSLLAKAQVSLFIISTFNDDIILFKNHPLETAKEALIHDDYRITT
jgi:hypothetical protein